MPLKYEINDLFKLIIIYLSLGYNPKYVIKLQLVVNVLKFPLATILFLRG